METMKRKKKIRMGRPPLPPDERRSEQLYVRVTPPERAEIEAEASRLGITVSELLMRPWREGQGGE